ncbi:hypothetical protein ILUMI_21218 [Ignelater luminosus]|uniref:Peptidase aspartic putative domain-containing protein n=1 Tax=Ignelater luminosus TaxID=2038154 RepID=A0A8K0G3T1_IGNLU|nr:hypothetical protein ILUMI_21218 [Ignelater luminosus]
MLDANAGDQISNNKSRSRSCSSSRCLPNVKVNISDWKLPDNVSLADPKFNIPKQIDLLIGASHCWRIVRAGIIHLGKGMPVLQNTEFGYTVTGQINYVAMITEEIGNGNEENEEIENNSMDMYLAMTTGNLRMIPSGIHYGWPSPSLPKLLQNDLHIPITSDEGSWIAVMLLPGAFSGSVLGDLLLDRI